MATYTDNYNLKKPEETDFYSVQDFNDNMDDIDEEFAKRVDFSRAQSLTDNQKAQARNNIGAAATNHNHTKNEVDLNNVDNVRQYSASNPPPYPVTSINGRTGAIIVQELTNNLTEEAEIADNDAIPYHDTSETAQRKTTWSNIKAKLKTYFDTLYGTYTKPSGGIPKSDLASAVQTSLGKADSALQSHQDISGKQDKTNSLIEETALADSDTIPFYDESATVHRKTTWSNAKAKLKTYFDTLYAAATHNHAQSDITGLSTALSTLDERIDDIDETIDSKLIGAKAWKEIARFTTVGNHTFTADFTGKIGVLVVSGGQSGAYSYKNSTSSSIRVRGGSSGNTNHAVGSVAAGDTFDVVVGAGGAPVRPGSSSYSSADGNYGDKSSFGELTAESYKGSTSTIIFGASLGGGTATPTGHGYDSLYGLDSYEYYDESISKIKPWQCVNPFTGEAILGGGGGLYRNTSGVVTLGEGGKNALTGIGGGDSCAYPNTSGINPDATEFGCGGGAAWGGTNWASIVSGKGGDGIVIVYREVTL